MRNEPLNLLKQSGQRIAMSEHEQWCPYRMENWVGGETGACRCGKDKLVAEIKEMLHRCRQSTDEEKKSADEFMEREFGIGGEDGK